MLQIIVTQLKKRKIKLFKFNISDGISINGALEERMEEGEAESGTQDTSVYSNNKVILNANGKIKHII